MRRHGRASIRTLRRWGLRRRTILKCLLGFHGRPWQGRCARCGEFLPEQKDPLREIEKLLADWKRRYDKPGTKLPGHVACDCCEYAIESLENALEAAREELS